jgi:hypothetical protein
MFEYNRDRGGQANFTIKSSSRKSANSWVHSAIASPQIFRCASPQITNLHNFMNNPQIANFY